MVVHVLYCSNEECLKKKKKKKKDFEPWQYANSLINSKWDIQVSLLIRQYACDLICN